MKFKFLLLFSASCVLLGGQPGGMTTAIALSPQAPAGTLTKAADAYRSCQQAASAVVTLYSGTEIGSGSLVDADGTILTAQHVVKEALRSPSKVKVYVKLANGNRYVGRAIASDTRNDLALIQIPVKEPLSTLALANDASLQTGQKVCAIGSPAGRTGVLSQGMFKSLLANGDLQSAVRLTYGNSGGPLLNAQGALVGVNKSIWVSGSGENTGVSYATGVQAIQTFLSKNHRNAATSIAAGEMKQPITASVPAALPSPSVGFPQAQLPQPSTQARIASTTILGANFDGRDMTVQRVEPGSPAELGGLRPGDRLLAINGNPLNGRQQLDLFLSQQPSTAVLTLDRDRQITNIQVNF